MKSTKLRMQMIGLKAKIRKEGDSKQKIKQAHKPPKNFQTTSNLSTTSQPTKSSHTGTYLPTAFM